MKTIITISILALCLLCTSGTYAQLSNAKSDITAFNSHVMVPKAFSPNFDGINDSFKVTGKDVSKFEIHIYNRQGQLVYHSEDINASWDGKYEGIMALGGIYVWIIEYEGHTAAMGQLKHTVRGNLTLLL